jgi:hypothetical protein
LENTLNKYKINEINYKKAIEEVNKMIEENEKKEKDLKQEMYSLKKIMRSLPTERQFNIYK